MVTLERAETDATLGLFANLYKPNSIGWHHDGAPADIGQN
jgi:hypothetical protein